MSQAFVTLVLILALSACAGNDEPVVIELKDWTPPPEVSTTMPDTLPLADETPVATPEEPHLTTSSEAGSRETIAGVRIVTEIERTDLGDGPMDYIHYDAKYRGGTSGVLIPVDWIPDVEGIDVLVWSGDGTVMMYAVEVGPGVHEIVVRGPADEVVDRVVTEPGEVVPVASPYSLSQTTIEGRDRSGATLGTCRASETHSSLLSCD